MKDMLLILGMILDLEEFEFRCIREIRVLEKIKNLRNVKYEFLYNRKI